MKKFSFIFLLGFIFLSAVFNKKLNTEIIQISTNSQNLRKQKEHLPAYKEYNSTIALSQKLKKPILLYFTGHAVVNAKKMEMRVLKDELIYSRMNDDFILLKLYVDNITELQKENWITNSETKEVLKTVGQQNLYIENLKFNEKTQPFFVVLDSNENVYGKIGYTPIIKDFNSFLKESFERFKK